MLMKVITKGNEEREELLSSEPTKRDILRARYEDTVARLEQKKKVRQLEL